MTSNAQGAAKSTAEIRRFYQAELRPLLAGFETRRGEIIRRTAVVAVVLAGLGVPLALFVRGALLMLGAAILLGLGAWWWQHATRTFVREFKQDVVSRVMRFAEPGLSYRPEQHLPFEVFRRSQLFQHRVDRYRGEDLAQGTLGVTDLRFCELHAEYKTQTTNSRGQRQTHWHTIFKGLFVVADFNKHFNGVTVVLPDTAQRALGFLGQKLQEWNAARPELVKLEDPDFERAFVVYANDQVEARYILSTSLMRRILEFREKCGRDIYLSFADARLFVAVPSTRDLFEPRFMRSLVDEAMVTEMVRDIEMATAVVHDLNLNRRIWTKA